MDYQLVASDFDDTLLRSDRTVSDYTLKVIREFEAAGGTFLIVTGRMMPSILAEMEKWGIEGIVVGYAGALILDTRTKRILHQSPVANADAAEIVLELEALGLQVQLYVGDELLVDRINEYTEAYCRACNVPARELSEKMSDYLIRTGISPHKVLAFAPPELVQKQIRHINGEHPRLYACYSKPVFIEIMSRETNKARAVEIVANLKGVPIKKTIAVGDSNNDVPMIAFAGLGAAVSNAGEEAKAAADLIIGSNDEDGVAKMIEQYCLNR